MLIDKPDGIPHETPWHQDVGYFAMPVAPPRSATTLEDVQLWLAQDPVDEANGCTQFLPRAFGAPSLTHRVAAGNRSDEGRLIAIDESIDTTTAVACPLAARGCTVHLIGTPHSTGANTSTRSRRAYIFTIGPSALSEITQGAIRSPP